MYWLFVLSHAELDYADQLSFGKTKIIIHKEYEIDMQIDWGTDLKALKDKQGLETLLGQKLRQKNISWGKWTSKLHIFCGHVDVRNMKLFKYIYRTKKRGK